MYLSETVHIIHGPRQNTPPYAYREPYQYVSHLFSFYDCVTRSASTNPKATKTTARQGPRSSHSMANMPIGNRQ